MNLVLCNGCGNRFEDSALRRDGEKRLVCEECVAQAAAPKPNAATKVTPPPPPASPSSPERPSRRDELLDYIVTNANVEFVEHLVRIAFVESAKWVEILESESNERVLLRLATELGYGRPETAYAPGAVFKVKEV